MNTDRHGTAEPQPKESEPKRTARQENRKHRNTGKPGGAGSVLPGFRLINIASSKRAQKDGVGG